MGSGSGSRPPMVADPAFCAPVLPKYEVKVLLPPVISILDREATFSVCGKWVLLCFDLGPWALL